MDLHADFATPRAGGVVALVERARFTVARQVFDARRAHGTSQEHTAHLAEIDVHTYRRLETGVGGSSLDSLLRTMIALGIENIQLPRMTSHSGENVELPSSSCRGCRFVTPEDKKKRAMRLVLEHLDECLNRTPAPESAPRRLGFGVKPRRRWAQQTQADAGVCDRDATSESEQIRQLERENRELREANAILRDAAVFFAGELDPRRR